MKILIVSVFILAATSAHAQSVSNRVTGAVGGATANVGASAGVGGSGSGSGSGSAGATDFSILNTTPGSSTGGEWSGGARTRIGGQDIILRGAVANEGNSSAFKAGAGVGF